MDQGAQQGSQVFLEYLDRQVFLERKDLRDLQDSRVTVEIQAYQELRDDPDLRDQLEFQVTVDLVVCQVPKVCQVRLVSQGSQDPQEPVPRPQDEETLALQGWVMMIWSSLGMAVGVGTVHV